MSGSKRWKPDSLAADLSTLSDELDRVYAPERAILTSGLTERIIARLPRPTPALCRFARLLWLTVLIGSLAVTSLGAQMLLMRLHGPAEVSAFRAIIAVLAALSAIAISLLAPKLAFLDSRLRSRFLGQRVPPTAWDVVMVRIAALALLAVGGASIIGI